jgi:hypothetical protein
MSYSTLNQEKFLVLREFVAPEWASEMAKTFKIFCESECIPGDHQDPLGSSYYGFPCFSEMFYEKISHLNNLLGLKLLPTYHYARVYRSGSALRPHVDRDACEISVSVHLGADGPWPIYFGEVGGKAKGVELGVGDAVIYLGREITHWREPYGGEYYVQSFLHYVNSRGDFANLVNDKNSCGGT